MYQKFVEKQQTIENVAANNGKSARSRLIPFFASAGVAYPPDKIALLAIKDTAVLELWAEAAMAAKLSAATH